jgi:hypothetical protein
VRALSARNITLRIANVTATRQRTLIAASYLPELTLLTLGSFIYGFTASMIYGWITAIITCFSTIFGRA